MSAIKLGKNISFEKSDERKKTVKDACCEGVNKCHLFYTRITRL